MSKGKRNRYSTEFKAKMAKEALKYEETLAQLAVCLGAHLILVALWKKLVMDGLVGIVSGKPERQSVRSEAHTMDRTPRSASPLSIFQFITLNLLGRSSFGELLTSTNPETRKSFHFNLSGLGA